MISVRFELFELNVNEGEYDGDGMCCDVTEWESLYFGDPPLIKMFVHFGLRGKWDVC